MLSLGYIVYVDNGENPLIVCNILYIQSFDNKISFLSSLMMSENCFCGSALPYAQCCELVHSNLENAQTCEQLMRARYSAFVLQKIDFIYETFHPQTRRFQNKKEIAQWSQESNWQELNILKTTPSTVEFKAIYLDKNLILQEHHEKSNFKKMHGRWYYVDGKLLA